MLTCRMVTRLFVDFLGEGAPAEYRELIEEHLAACPQCTSAAESYREVIRLARRLPPKPVSPKLLEALRRTAREEGLEPPGNSQ